MDAVARSALLLFAAFVVLAVVLWYGLYHSPYRTREFFRIDQPVPFSHQHHTSGLGIDCRYCHQTVEAAGFAGMPTTDTCMHCHGQIWKDSPFLAPVRDSFVSGIPLRWTRVTDLPDYVYFNHSMHVTHGIGCTTCHGPVGEMPLMYRFAPLTMRWCLDCHEDPTPNLRPKDAVFDPSYTPERDQAALGQELFAQYRIRKERLTDCTVCHR